MRISTFVAALLFIGSAMAGTQETFTLIVPNMTCAACPIPVK